MEKQFKMVAFCEKMMSFVFLHVILFLVIGRGFVLPQDFGYDEKNGPHNWWKQYNTCIGKHQSPININLLTVKEGKLPPMDLRGFSERMDGIVVSNNGHTVMLKIENHEQPSISGGPLSSDYVFSQMHFHWGDNDSVGSEDKINSRAFPMELHMVFYKREYGDAKNALDHKDGLCVLAFFFELDRFRHPAYDLVTAALSNVTEPHTSMPLSSSLSFFDLVPYDLDHYFTYNGSLTTPPCSEVVTWIDYEQPIRLSHDQIDGFRKMRSDHGRITHNFRPLQPLGDRIVLYNTERNGYFDNSIEEEYVTLPFTRQSTQPTTPPRPPSPGNSMPEYEIEPFDKKYSSLNETKNSSIWIAAPKYTIALLIWIYLSFIHLTEVLL